MENFYKSPKVKKFLKATPNTSWDDTHIDINSRILIVGGSGDGKTNGAMNYLTRCPGVFSRAIVCSRGQPEPLYEAMEAELGKSNSVDFFTLETLPDPREIYENMEDKLNDQYLIIFDDLICDMKKAKYAARMQNFFIMGRKCHLTMMFLTQSFYEVPKIIRQQMTYVCLMSNNSNHDLGRIVSEFSHLGVTAKQLRDMHKLATEQPFSWLKIDLKTTDPQLRFARNFTDAFNLQNVEYADGEEGFDISPGNWFRKRKLA